MQNRPIKIVGAQQGNGRDTTGLDMCLTGNDKWTVGICTWLSCGSVYQSLGIKQLSIVVALKSVHLVRCERIDCISGGLSLRTEN